MPSYSVKCHFEWPAKATQRQNLAHLYEERITVWQSSDINDAIERAEGEAKEYASREGFLFLEYSQAFWLFEEIDVDGLEIYSLLRESNLEPETYLDTFHDTGYERQV